jgi:tetratricopeptide (TPR) repeat protein
LETLRALYEQGTLKRDAQGVRHTPWDAPETDYQELPLPQGLRQVIDGRVRDLAPQERAALAAAAVLGHTFSPSVLARMTDAGMPERQGDEAISEPPLASPPPQPLAPAGPWSSVTSQLLRRQFLAEDSAGYRFEHELLREVIYDRLDSTTRQTLHLRAAEALEHEHYARVEALAQHLYLAEAWEKAAPYLAQAGDRARAVCAYRDALRNYDHAIEAIERQELEPGHIASLWDIQLKRGAVATPLGDYAIAIAAYEAVLALADRNAAAPDVAAHSGARKSAQIQALNGLCFIHGQRNDYPAAQQVIQQAMQLAAESPRLIDRAEVYYQAGLISFRKDDYAEARRFIGKAIDLYNSLGRDTERAKCLLTIGWSYLRQEGPTDEVIGYYLQALEVYRQQDDRFAEYSCLSDASNAYLLRGSLAKVVQTVEQCLPFFRSVGALDDISVCLFRRGEAYRRMGRLEGAIESLQESFTICTELDRIFAAEFSQVSIASTLRDMGRLNDAMEALDSALHTTDRMVKTRALLVATDIWTSKIGISCAWDCLAEGFMLARWLGSKAYLGIAYRLLAQLRLADIHRQLPQPDNQAPDAEASFAESMRLLQEAHSDDELAISCMAYGQYLAVAGRTVEARAMLVQAQQLMSRCGMAGALEQAQQLLQSLPKTPTALQPGQQVVKLARRGVPRGRPLRPEELVEVVWTVAEPEQCEVGRAVNKAATRQERLLRLCAEADAQGAEPTVGDLAEALGVTARTVDRDIAALRAAGETLVTRGGSG